MYYIALFSVFSVACATPILVGFRPDHEALENLSHSSHTVDPLLTSKEETESRELESEENVEDGGLRRKRSTTTPTVKDEIQKIINCILFKNHNHLPNHCYTFETEGQAVEILHWNKLVMSPNGTCAVQLSAPHGITEVRCHPRVANKRCNTQSTAHWTQLYAAINDNDGSVPKVYSTAMIPIGCACASVSARRLNEAHRPQLPA